MKSLDLDRENSIKQQDLNKLKKLLLKFED